MQAMEDLSRILATNLHTWMERRKLPTQMALASASKVAQKTISNALHPDNRPTTKSGKQSSITLSNIEKLARALKVPAWVLLRPSVAQNDEVIMGLSREVGGGRRIQ